MKYKKRLKCCLLCLQEKANRIRLYSKRGLYLHIFEILIKHLPWLKDYAEKDNKQRICLVCWRKLREFHEFYQSVAKAYKREETYDLNVKFLDKYTASAASDDESLDDPLPASAETDEPNNDQCLAPFEMEFLEDHPLPVPVKAEESENNECIATDIKMEENVFEMDFLEEVEALVDIQVIKEPIMLSSEAGTLLESEVEPTESGRALRATRRSQRKEDDAIKNEFTHIKIEKLHYKDEDSETELPLSKLSRKTSTSSKPKKRGRPVKPVEKAVKDKIVQIETKKQQNKTKIEDNSRADFKISDDESNFDDNAPSSNENAFDDSDSLSDIDELERRADIVAPQSPEKPRKKRIRLRPNDSYRRMTQEEKDMRKLKQEKRDEIIATFFKSFPCPKCNYLVLTFGEMRKHFNSKHSGTKASVLCCGRRFPERRALADHVLVHLNPEHFKCSDCGQSFPSSDALKKHVKSHSETPEEKPAFVCEICSKSFTMKGGLKGHLLSKHTPESDYKFSCKECPKKFPTKSHLKSHEKTVHRRGIKVICDQCGRTLGSSSSLRYHIRSEHSDKPPAKPARVQCSICKKSMASAHTLKQHTLSMHMEPHNVGEYRCHICGYLSVNARALKRHIYYNHKAERKFKCTMCDKAFKKKENLKEHIAMHTGEGVHTCPECQMTFACKANFFKHRQRRHGHKPEKRNLIGLAEKKLQKLKATAEKQAEVPLFYSTDEQGEQTLKISLVNN